MASEPPKNVAASVRDRLLNRSREERTDFQLLLTRYALERLLYRLSRSEHRAICNQPVENDGVVFDVDGLEAALIREDSEYGGVRIRTQATIAGARLPIQVDVGFGDAITNSDVQSLSN